MLFVVIAFSEHHVDQVLQLVGKLPVVGEKVSGLSTVMRCFMKFKVADARAF